MIAIGVPTVIDARTLILDAAKASEAEAEQAGIAQASRCENLAADENRTHAEAAHADFLERYLADEAFDMIVTSTDIDAVIQSFSQILANAINHAASRHIFIRAPRGAKSYRRGMGEA